MAIRFVNLGTNMRCVYIVNKCGARVVTLSGGCDPARRRRIKQETEYHAKENRKAGEYIPDTARPFGQRIIHPGIPAYTVETMLGANPYNWSVQRNRNRCPRLMGAEASVVGFQTWCYIRG